MNEIEKLNHRLLLEEQLKRAKLRYYQKNPLAWLSERFQEDITNFDWELFPEYKNHKWDGSPSPLKYAWEAVAQKQWVAISAATGTSKTYFLSRLVLWFLDCFPDSLVVTSAPKEPQLKLHLWSEIGKVFNKFKAIRPEANLTSLKLTIGQEGKSEYEGWQAVGFVAGVGADEQSATKAQGFHRENMLIITEETPGMNSAVMTAFQNTCTGSNNIIVAVGNPDNELDELAQFGQQLDVLDFRLSAYDYPNVVLQKEIFPGAVSIPSIERRKSKYGEGSPLFNSRVRGITPKQSSNSLIKLDWIEMAIGATIQDDITYYNALGVDVANSANGDEAALAYGKGSELKHLIEFSCPSASDIAYNLIYDKRQLQSIRDDVKSRGVYAIRDFLSHEDLNKRELELILEYPIFTLEQMEISASNVGIDSVGVGASTVNTFTNLGFQVTSLGGGDKPWEEVIPKDNEDKPMYKFLNLRAQMYWELREDFRKGKVTISNEIPIDIIKKLKKELVTIRFELRENSIAIEKKDKIKQRLGNSPNLADCMVYWNWMRKGYRSRYDFAVPLMA